MYCERYRLPDGTIAIVSFSGRRPVCFGCGAAAPGFQCDWKLRGKRKDATCLKHLCASCARQVGPDKHLCPPHARMWDAHPANPRNQTKEP